MKRILAALGAALLVTQAFAQDWGKVNELYQKGMYAEVVSLLDGHKGAVPEGYRTLCALALRSDSAAQMADVYLEAWPESALVPQIRYQLALDLFDQDRFEDALAQFDRLSQSEVYPSQVPEFTYKYGYSAYRVGEWERAKSILTRLNALPYSDFTAPAYYTLGYINYAQGQFKEASEWFLLSAKDYRFQSLASYYILECRFNEKDYAYVVKFGEDIFNKIPQDRQPHMARIMSESYLVLGDVAKARAYYDKNLSGKSAATRSDYFYSGELLYLIEDWAGAVENFGKMEERTDSLGQIANYQMGFSYIKLHNKVAAMEAFKEAAQPSFQADIQEDAFYNYAKLAFDLGGDTAPFQEYMRRWNALAKGNQIYSYMAMVALQNHDYEAAVEAYDHIDELDPRMQSNYMKAYMLRARELMESGSWRAAVPHLKAAAYYSPRRDGFNQLARYYQAEALYRDGKYQEARSILTDLYNLSALNKRQEGRLITYQLAYTYFKEADYMSALNWFQKYVTSADQLMGADARTRMADCYFFRGDYVNAVDAYERQLAAYPDSEDLYTAYRAGVAAGLLNDNPRKVQFLKRALSASPQAPYYGETLYELGRAYVSLGQETEALATFDLLRERTPDRSLQERALLELGMIARNGGRSDQALGYYKQVVAQGGDYSEDALLAIEAIYRTREDPDAYLAYVNSLGAGAGRTEAQKEEVYFSSAEQIFLSGDYNKAQNTLQSYLQKYPQAIYAAKARFYLAECLRSNDAREAAADQYLAALDGGLEGALAESALARYAALNFELGSFGKAYGAYVKLKEMAMMPENRQAAQLGMMRSAYKAREWEDALSDASAVAAAFPQDADLQREAAYIRAKAYLSTSRRAQAMAECVKLSQQPSTDEGAEATYLLIQDQYDRGAFDGIQDKVYDFSGKAGGQNYWLAKAFIVLGDTFAEQGNLSQARATFESIKGGYTPEGTSDDVLDQVELRLRKLQN